MRGENQPGRAGDCDSQRHRGNVGIFRDGYADGTWRQITAMASVLRMRGTLAGGKYEARKIKRERDIHLPEDDVETGEISEEKS